MTLAELGINRVFFSPIILYTNPFFKYYISIIRHNLYDDKITETPIKIRNVMIRRILFSSAHKNTNKVFSKKKYLSLKCMIFYRNKNR